MTRQSRSVYVQDVGQGPAVLVLHGVPGSIESMTPVSERLSSQFRVLTPAMPGYRGSSPASPDLGEDMRVVDAAVRSLGVDEVFVVGFSAGGYRGLWLALHGDVNVRGVHMLGGYAGFTPEDAALARGLAGAIRQLSDFEQGEIRDIAAKRMFSNAYFAAHPEAVKEVYGWFDNVLSTESLADEFEAMAEAADLAPELARLAIPVVARVGAEDAASPVGYSEVVAELAPAATLEVVPGAGHALLTEDAEATLDSIEAAARAAYGIA